MPDSLAASRTHQIILVGGPSCHIGHACSHIENLKSRGINLIPCPSPKVAQHALQTGCRVGLLMLCGEKDLQSLGNWESFLNPRKISWVGLISPTLIRVAGVRQFIAEHLFNFVTTPADPDHLVLAIRHALDMAFMSDLNCKPPPDLAVVSDMTMVGKSTQMQQLSEQIRKVARTDAAVLITGQSGTGKELAALAIHRHSSRKTAPFVAVNCGAIAQQLAQSELFGHEKGAFTGASQRKIGRIEAAQGGTLFLDEIGDMPFDMQVNLLRFLQEKTIERVGGNDTVEIDVRIIAATHVDLASAVKQGRFREDLYYRINVIGLVIPTLAERGQDIEDIAHHYFARFAATHNKSLRGFSKAAMNAIVAHPWPGNVRELVNRVQRATVMAEGRFIQPEDLGFERTLEAGQTMSLENARAAAEQLMIERALAQARNRISRAATLLGISRATLHRLMEKYDICSETSLNM